MFQLVVLSALLAFAAAAPSIGHAIAPVTTYSAVVGSVPASVSHTSSSVVHSAAVPLVAAPVLKAAPLVAAAPIVKAAPVVAASAVVGSVPTTVSHTSSSVVHSAALAAPVVSTYAAAPALVSAYTAHSAPVVSAYSAPVVSAYSAPVVSAPFVHRAAPAIVKSAEWW